MKQFTKLSLLFFAALLVFTSCDEEKYADWKVMNEIKYANDVAAKTDYTLSESGLCYKIIHQGETPKKVNITSRVQVKYTGKLITGAVFDSRTEYLYVSETVLGWQEALTKLNVGGKIDFFLPAGLGYSENKTGSIPPYSTLYFSVEVLNAIN